MQSLVARCQQQCTRRLPGTLRIRATVPSSASDSPGSSLSATTPAVGSAAAAHGRFFSVCRRTMVWNAIPNVNPVPPPPRKKARKPFSGAGPSESRRSVRWRKDEEQDNQDGSRATRTGGEGSSRSRAIEPSSNPNFPSSSRSQTQPDVAASASSNGVSGQERQDLQTVPPPSSRRPPLPEVHAPPELLAFWSTCEWLLRHTALGLGYRMMPDGFVPLTDMLRYEALAHVTPQEFMARIRRDPRDRFEMAMLPDYVDGVAQERWWVRARWGHSMLGVGHQSKRILNSSKLTFVAYIGQISEWERIQKHGLNVKDYEDSLIPLSQQKDKDFFEGWIPQRTSLLCIRIDADEAIRKGVMFFHDNDTRLVSVGNRDGIIPPSLFTGAIEVDIEKEVLQE
ncbi:hypothetical protein CVT24_007343 [Panaeolus cyanescens]|uniref:2'-phosphotransferase n=1 Tax=Panaeolus cyanescens TaxID=181874 RepID=A0A409W5I1_9AGAR|nr:hypothetical protein CVT24_007343 [Panaeolus cyanescens]